MQKLFYYKVGLGVIGLFTLGIFIFAMVQGASAKQDTQTDKAAQKIASTLNDYTDNNQRIPKDLAEAGVHDNTAHITYTKLSDEKYKFCVDYKSASEDYTSSVENVVGRGLYGGATNYGSTSSTEDQSSLYIPSSHKKGQNCQTVAPYMISANSTGSSAGTSGSSDSSSSSGSGTGANCPGPGYPDSASFSGDISSITKTDGTPITGSENADMLVKIQTDTDGDKMLTITAGNTNVFDYTCTALPHTHMQEGDYVTVYQQNSNPSIPDALIDYSAN